MSLGEVKICTLPGLWEMVGAPASKQCCSKHCCSLGAAEALGAVAIATAATAAPNRSAVWCIQSTGFGLALPLNLPIGLHVAHDLIRVLALVALPQRPLQRSRLVSMLDETPVPRLVDVGEGVPEPQKGPEGNPADDNQAHSQS